MNYKFEKPVHGEIGTTKYKCTISWRNGKFISDEPATLGGADEGPDPFTLLLASLTSCTLITLRMYIDRKGWNIPAIAVNANLFQEVSDGKTRTVIDRDVLFLSAVPDEQKARLQDIAAHCPISKILENEVIVRTSCNEDKTLPEHNVETPETHL